MEFVRRRPQILGFVQRQDPQRTGKAILQHAVCVQTHVAWFTRGERRAANPVVRSRNREIVHQPRWFCPISPQILVINDGPLRPLWLLDTAIFLPGICYMVIALAVLSLIRRSPGSHLYLPFLRLILWLSAIGTLLPCSPTGCDSTAMRPHLFCAQCGVTQSVCHALHSAHATAKERLEMNILVVYDSQYGNTEQLARAIGDTAQAVGPVQVARADTDEPATIGDIDLLIVGCPTQGWRPTSAMRSFLAELDTEQTSHLAVACFDTRFQKSRLLTGSAARVMARTLRAKGMTLIVPPESFFVRGTEGPLVEGELDRAAAWAHALLTRTEASQPALR
jgi:flavodoxin